MSFHSFIDQYNRVQKVLIITAFIQCLLSIAVYYSASLASFAIFIAFAGGSLLGMLMTWRVMYVAYAVGSFAFSIYLFVVTARAQQAKDYVEVTLLFIVAAFELLIVSLCLYHVYALYMDLQDTRSATSQWMEARERLHTTGVDSGGATAVKPNERFVVKTHAGYGASSL